MIARVGNIEVAGGIECQSGRPIEESRRGRPVVATGASGAAACDCRYGAIAADTPNTVSFRDIQIAGPIEGDAARLGDSGRGSASAIAAAVLRAIAYER